MTRWCWPPGGCWSAPCAGDRCPAGHRAGTVLENACRAAGFSPRIAAEGGDLDTVVALAAEGLGIAVLPRSALERDNLAIVRITRPRLERRTALAWNPAAMSPAARAFLALADEHFRG
ncbi:MAG TPA: LysR family transcriptional regulator substrate-binding protein [Solirubrobacteraceae bacterium]